MKINKIRGLIILLPLLSFIISLLIDNIIVQLSIITVSFIATVLILYFNMGALSDISPDNPKINTLKVATIFDIIIFLTTVIVAILIGTNVIQFSENGEKYFAGFIVTAVILFIGNIAVKLPFTKHTGLRLPWTVTDEETWVVAHRILSYTSIPLALIYIACIPTIPLFEILTLITILLWVGIPAVLSYIFYRKKINKDKEKKDDDTHHEEL